jgi:hypothetical protein
MRYTTSSSTPTRDGVEADWPQIARPGANVAPHDQHPICASDSESGINHHDTIPAFHTHRFSISLAVACSYNVLPRRQKDVASYKRSLPTLSRGRKTSVTTCAISMFNVQRFKPQSTTANCPSHEALQRPVRLLAFFPVRTGNTDTPLFVIPTPLALSLSFLAGYPFLGSVTLSGSSTCVST